MTDEALRAARRAGADGEDVAALVEWARAARRGRRELLDVAEVEEALRRTVLAWDAMVQRGQTIEAGPAGPLNTDQLVRLEEIAARVAARTRGLDAKGRALWRTWLRLRGARLAWTIYVRDAERGPEAARELRPTFMREDGRAAIVFATWLTGWRQELRDRRAPPDDGLDHAEGRACPDGHHDFPAEWVHSARHMAMRRTCGVCGLAESILVPGLPFCEACRGPGAGYPIERDGATLWSCGSGSCTTAIAMWGGAPR